MEIRNYSNLLEMHFCPNIIIMFQYDTFHFKRWILDHRIWYTINSKRQTRTWLHSNIQFSQTEWFVIIYMWTFITNGYRLTFLNTWFNNLEFLKIVWWTIDTIAKWDARWITIPSGDEIIVSFIVSLLCSYIVWGTFVNIHKIYFVPHFCNWCF